MAYDGEIYYYIKNQQGDIVEIVDADGSTVVEYGYDAWGKNIYTKGSKAEGVGKDNPFRYRGYVYDEETELYYLRSRYYDSEWGRFLNADDEEQVTKENNLSGNIFVYCLNNPVICLDSDGKTAALAMDVTLLSESGTVLLPPEVLTTPKLTLPSNLTQLPPMTIDVGVTPYLGKGTILEFNTIGPRIRCNTRKEAYERAKRAGGGKEPDLHKKSEYGPHYHPSVRKQWRDTPKSITKHDHYFFPKRYLIVPVSSNINSKKTTKVWWDNSSLSISNDMI